MAAPLDAADDFTKLQDGIQQSELHIYALKAEFQGQATANSQQQEQEQPPESADLANPAAIEQETLTQKDFFSKLKFKYIEHAAKDKFLKHILSEEPPPISSEDNTALDNENTAAKAQLKSAKVALEDQYARIRTEADGAAVRHARIKADADEAAQLARKIADMKLEIARLRAAHPPEERLTIPEAESLFETQNSTIETLDADLVALNARVASTETALAASTAELDGLVPARVKAEAEAAEAVRGSERGKETMARLCAWYTSALKLQMALFGISGISAVSENELRIAYAPPGARAYTLSMVFNPATRRLANARVVEPGMPDIQEIVELAVNANDVPRLVRDVGVMMRRGNSALGTGGHPGVNGLGA
ncbi:hypothetical protein BOTBODRAFT_192514 [Botryobasidium botryosum FD-172 SS1]|uniref:Kinetochore protein Sos7 coiled-coil domain-containing protein n=1 Tax=Botryobasidium botryosum (strain FD-172 SS1) TaxID=930990 RepID=A0A067LVG3_BOTB1|nr:hypothetical protein BOTBODRAFT_192514 [Botryobasidium botryosum FD-172 SS1]